MKHKKVFILSLLAAFIFGTPMKWLFYKGETEVSNIFQLFTLDYKNIFFDFSLLFLNTLIIYFIVLVFIKKFKKEEPNSSHS